MSAWQEYLRFLVTLTAVLDPFLAVPIFLALTASRSAASRVALVRAVAIAVFAVLAAGWLPQAASITVTHNAVYVRTLIASSLASRKRPWLSWRQREVSRSTSRLAVVLMA